jgi:hypothetical protein
MYDVFTVSEGGSSLFGYFHDQLMRLCKIKYNCYVFLYLTIPSVLYSVTLEVVMAYLKVVFQNFIWKPEKNHKNLWGNLAFTQRNESRCPEHEIVLNDQLLIS